MIKLFTSEQVLMGHPDKVCDLISDSILTEYLKGDENSRVACEVMGFAHGFIVSGEITSKAVVDINELVNNVYRSIGYTDDIEIINRVNCQSSDISNAVNKEKLCAGDQGMMFGYATNETSDFMPYSIYFANKLARRIDEARLNGEICYLLPDGKCQVTVILDDNKLVGIDTIVVSVQHMDIDMDILRNDIKTKVIDKVFPSDLIKNSKILINPSGRFVIGGCVGDTGLTGRKIICDTYGGVIAHGGGAFSGKDYTKVDRSGAYYSRYVCKNLVASGVADKIMLEVSYAIGVNTPVSIYIDCYNTNKVSEDKIMDIINKVFDFSVDNIVTSLDMKKMDYRKCVNYSHFGKDNLSYEKIDKVDEIKKLL